MAKPPEEREQKRLRLFCGFSGRLRMFRLSLERVSARLRMSRLSLERVSARLQECRSLAGVSLAGVWSASEMEGSRSPQLVRTVQ